MKSRFFWSGIVLYPFFAFGLFVAVLSLVDLFIPSVINPSVIIDSLLVFKWGTMFLLGILCALPPLGIALRHQRTLVVNVPLLLSAVGLTVLFPIVYWLQRRFALPFVLSQVELFLLGNIFVLAVLSPRQEVGSKKKLAIALGPVALMVLSESFIRAILTRSRSFAAGESGGTWTVPSIAVGWPYFILTWMGIIIMKEAIGGQIRILKWERNALAVLVTLLTIICFVTLFPPSLADGTTILKLAWFYNLRSHPGFNVALFSFTGSYGALLHSIWKQGGRV